MKKIDWKKYINKSKMADLIVLGALLCISVLFAYKIGLLICGCYFADDHEIVRLNAMIHDIGLLRTMQSWLSADMHLRFRPVYWIFRVAESFLLGNHVFLWHLVKAVEIACCAFCMYLFSRKMKLNVYISVLFSVMSFLGTQCAVIFRLGPQEPLALIWMFMALIFAIRCHEHDSRWNKLGFIIFMILMMGTKESFVLLAPILVFFLCYLDWREQEVFSVKKYAQTLLKYRDILLTVILCFFLCIGIIVFYSGTGSTGYAGFDGETSVTTYAHAVWSIWTGSMSLYLKIFIITLLLCICVWIYQAIKNKPPKAHWVFLRICELLIPLYFILTQSILHAKSGMDERYLLPCVTGILIYVVILSYPYFEMQRWSRILYYIGMSALFLCLAVNSRIISTTGNYVAVCVHNMQMLDRVSHLVENYDDKDTNIVISTQYGEWNMAFSAFMEELYGIHNVYALPQSDAGDGLAHDRYLAEGEEDVGIDITDADIYVVQNEYLPQKLAEKNIDLSRFSQEVFGYYIVYYR
jgi:hypothetical protein